MTCQTCNAPSTGDLCTRCRESVVAMLRRHEDAIESAQQTIGYRPRWMSRTRRRRVCAEQLAFTWRARA